ncbi:MAG TPA: CDP-diacylglycerol--glycerol-3-phosphate 3-phosphatidyltransferase [Candidatus Dormibacteraeota bacterium]|jgi:CDP-diacylglycerol--glycerol-3-phosphate 3-phosphatidyltransferase|nr:CDP-diacylglycerol--glycerol-3-phosphate 3-phosphatidyltransferase [Candidatus Dormibacteraeota bacterium]
MNISNALTLSRLVGIPILMALLLLRFPGHDQVAAALFIAFSLTDTLDGQLARRRGTVSDFGKFMDPLADKLFVLSVLIVLVQEGLVAAWVVVVIFSRELMITILRSVGAGQGRVIAAAPLGKTKTVTQMTAVTLLILQRPYPVLVPFAEVVVGIAVVFTVVSGLDYLWRFRYLIGPFDSSRTRVAAGGAPEVTPAQQLGDVLRGSGLTVSVAESSTGGMIGSLITDQPGSSTYFAGGVIAYSNAVKRDQLGVPESLLKSVGAVSREVAEAMADGVRRRLGTSLAVSVSGIAGPDADGTSKPVGLTFIAVASEARTSSREFRFTGDRLSNRRQAAAEALGMLIAEARLTAQTHVR